ncbi:MAG TPA: tetratricopeptide repeat protein [Opitutaceae bacterium]|jgi:tetratricopeptide (TPR) repeat protein
MEEPRSARTGVRTFWWTAVLIVGLAFIVYWPALRGGLLWDDDAHITKPELQSLSGLGRIWTEPGATQQYYPLLHSAFWVEHAVFGDAMLGYHVTNVLLHALAAILVVAVLARLGSPGAGLAGILFTVHPVCVESVAWVSEQKNTLSLVFYLLAALAFLRFDQRRGEPGSAGRYAVASVLFVAALLSKTVTATLPAALLVVAWWKRGRIDWKRDVVPVLPWFVLALASGTLTAVVERTLIGAEGSQFSLTLLDRCLLAGRVIWFYLGKLVWPFDLAFVYPRWNLTTGAWIGALGVAGALGATAALWSVRRRWRGPLAAWLFFIGTLFPALGFFNVYPFIFSYVADHFQYLACLGVLSAAAAGAALALSRTTPNGRAVGWSAIVAAMAGLVLLSNAQSATYADQKVLYETTIERNPGCWMAQNNLGLWYKDHGKPDQAMVHYREALRLRPAYAQAHNNLGVCFEDRGDMESAIVEFESAIHLTKDYSVAHNNLGIALGSVPGRLNEAVDQFQEAIREKPDFAEAYNNLGSALMKTPDRANEAIKRFRDALRLNPNFADAHSNLGDALSTFPERLEEAVSQYREALRLNPNSAEAHNNLGLALSSQGKTMEAIAEFNEALRCAPGFAEIHLNIAVALLSLPGARNEVIEQVKAYLRVRPENDTTRQILAQIQPTQP